jgi:GT2 family glycosyltransferase
LKKANNCIDAAGIAVCPDGLSIGRGRGERSDAYNADAEVFFVSDCCCLYRRAMLDEIGLYDADFFAYAEETDLGWRAQLYGWKSIYVPDAIVYHHHSASSGSHSPFKAYLVERNRIWLALKNFPLWLLAYGFLFSLVRYFWQAYAALSGKGRAGEFTKSYSSWRLIAVLLSAYRDALKGLPRVLAQRKALKPQRKKKNRRILWLITHYGIPAKSIALKA